MNFIFEWSDLELDTRLSDLLPLTSSDASQGAALCFVDTYTGEVIAEVEIGEVAPESIIINGPDTPIVESTNPLEFSIADGVVYNNVLPDPVKWERRNSVSTSC